MMEMCSFKSLALAILIALFVWSSSFETLCSGREMKVRYTPDSMYNSYQPYESVMTTASFNVLNFGAKGDGQTDDTKVIISTQTSE